MSDALTEDEMLHHHRLNIDNLLKECEFTNDSPSHVAGLIGNHNNIWSANCSSPTSSDFLSYQDITDGYQWSSYAVGDSNFKNSSPIRDESFTPLSQTESDAGSDNSWYGINGIDFSKATAEGAQHYAEALHSWNCMNGSTNGIYDPFKSSSVIDHLDGVQIPASSREKSPLKRSQSANTRPTFADVAKKPSSPGSEPPPTPILSNDGPVYESQESLNSLVMEKGKPKVFRPAHPRHGGYHVPLPIKPDSKYGLDDFEVQEGITKIERSYSCNDALDCSQSCSKNLGLEDNGGQSMHNSATDFTDGHPESAANGEWFDPKRIFQNGTARGRSESVPCDTILNNNVAARAQATAKSSSRRANASYINNLHDGNHRIIKQTNTDRAKPVLNGSSTTGVSQHTADMGSRNKSASCNGTAHHPNSSGTSAAGYYMSGTVKLGKFIAMEMLRYVLLTLMVIIGLTGQVVYFAAQNTCLVVTSTFTYLAVKVGLNSGAPHETDFNSFTKNAEQFTYGLEENIKLPETSEEAMQRLLTCQGKDAYSILGIRSDASDEEIKRYYRRQAVLVHPDKNQQPGAEEAFKILGQAVELIGTPEKRTIYDRKMQEEKLSEDVMRQFNDLLAKFHEKMEEASNWMQCNNCGDKHRRYLTDKPVYSARKCNRCQCHHAAKEGEIWAETTFMGFKWHFYACMENRIYDVTPWISCQPNMVDKFQPNSHTVRLRMSLSTNGNTPSRASSAASREADLENLLKNLFPQQGFNSDKTAQRHGHMEPNNTKTNGSACNKKGKRRARRR